MLGESGRDVGSDDGWPSTEVGWNGWLVWLVVASFPSCPNGPTFLKQLGEGAIRTKAVP